MRLGVCLIILGGVGFGLNLTQTILMGITYPSDTTFIFSSILLAWGIVRVYRKRKAKQRLYNE